MAKTVEMCLYDLARLYTPGEWVIYYSLVLRRAEAVNCGRKGQIERNNDE